MSSSSFGSFFGPSRAFSPKSEESLKASEHGAYAMIPSQPAIDAKEIETSEPVVEVTVRWGDDVVCVRHLAAGAGFRVGNDPTADFVVDMATVDLVTHDGTQRIAKLPSEATNVALKTADGAVAANGNVILADGTRLTFDFAGLSIQIGATYAAKRIAGHAKPNRRALGFHALSAGVHGAILATMFLFMPALGSTDSEEMTDDQKYALQNALRAVAEKETEQLDEKLSQTPSEESPEAGQAAKGESGKMGSSAAPATNKQYAIAGQSDEKKLGRQAALDAASSFGMIALLGESDPNAPVAPWGEVAMGDDPFSARGNMWGSELGESFGYGGLGLGGTGEGGGGKGQGIGIGNIGTIGSIGNCVGSDCGFGTTNGRLAARHQVGSFRMRPGTTNVSGHLPAEVIQRIVRQNFGRFRMCYESALRGNPSLQGRVAVRFVIGRDGAVSSVSNGGSDIPDAGVVSCVVRSFYSLSFPAPDNGIVSVTYPIMFTPGS